jgi:hypothetical protein
MLPYRDSKLTRILLATFFVIVISYAYFEARGLLYGPTITIPSETMSVTDDPYILIQGTAAHITALAVDGQPIQLTEQGAFQAPYVLASGTNRIVFDARDKYGNQTRKIIEIMYTPSASTTAPTSTASSSLPTVAPVR